MQVQKKLTIVLRKKKEKGVVNNFAWIESD